MRKDFFSRPAIHVLMIALLGVIVYSNTFHVPFIFDDHTSIINNKVIRSLEGFLSGAGYDFNPRRFVGYLTIALNYRLGGLDVTGYHVFNLVVHILSACLVYALTRLTLGTPYFRNAECGPSSAEGLRPAGGMRNAELTTQNSKFKIQNFAPLLAALLFVSHPVQTQAVTYIIQRLASLTTLFYLLSLVLYVKTRLSREARGAGWKVWGLYILSLASALLAMKTKEIAVTLPAIVLLYEFFFFSGKAGKRLIFLLPMLLTVAVVPLSMVEGGEPTGELISDLSEKTRAETLLPRADYLFTQFRVIVTYLRLLVLPVSQNLDYDYPVYHSLFTPPVFLSFLFLLALFGLAIYLFYQSKCGVRSAECGVQNLGSWKAGNSAFRIPHSAFRIISFGLLWFFITLSVESSVIPIADVIYEHRLYLPSVGVFIAVASSIWSLSGRLQAKLCIAFLALVILLLSATSWMRNRVWGDGVTLWQDVVSKSPGKARAHDNLGYSLLYEKGRVPEAIEEFKAALDLKPDYFPSRHALGVAYMKSGMTDKAIEQFRIAIQIKPDSPAAHYNLAVAFGEKGNPGEALVHYQAALALEPGNATAHYNLGIAFNDKGERDKAVEQFMKAVELKPDMVNAHYNLGILYGEMGSTSKAIGHLETVVKLKPNMEYANFNLGVNYFKAGLVDEACNYLETAIRLKPDDADFHVSLARAYAIKGWKDKALEQERLAKELQKRKP